jgi:hemerythrin
MVTTPPLLFPWSEIYSVKIGIVDTQHKNLVNILNELHQAMVGGHGKDKLGQVLSNLIKYTQVHFATEEKLMQAHGYTDFPAHKAEHDQLTSRVLEYRRKFLANEIGLTVEVMDFLKDWLSKHILGSDKKYAPFLNAKGVF